VLPLTISVPAQITRVMVGRVELVGPRERALLKTIAKGPTSDSQWMRPGQANLLKPPDDYQAYQNLGRFRDALLLDEQSRRPAKSLKQFIANYGLHANEIRSEPITKPTAAIL